MNPTIGRRDAHRFPRSARVNQTVTRPPHSRHVRQRGNGPCTSGRRGASGHAREAPVMPPERQRGQDEAAREGRAAASGAKPGGAKPGGARDAPAARGTARQRAHRRTRRVRARDPGQRKSSAFSQGRGQSARRAWRPRPADQPRPASQVRGRRSVSPPPESEKRRRTQSWRKGRRMRGELRRRGLGLFWPISLRFTLDDGCLAPEMANFAMIYAKSRALAA